MRSFLLYVIRKYFVGHYYTVVNPDLINPILAAVPPPTTADNLAETKVGKLLRISSESGTNRTQKPSKILFEPKKILNECLQNGKLPQI